MTAKVDTLLEVETPEGVHLNLRCAGLGPRMLAGLIDLLVIAVIWFGFSMILMVMLALVREVAVVLMTLMGFLLSWFYPAACELLMEGQTIGKRSLGLRVVQTSGAPVTWRHSVVRSVLWSLDLFFCISLPVMLLGRDFRRIGDLAADTVVVYVDDKASLARQRKRRKGREEASGEPVSAGQFSREETQAILAFADRADQISEDRQRELAGIVAAGFDRTANETMQVLRNHALYVQGADR